MEIILSCSQGLYSPRVLDITGRAELRTKMDTQQPMIYKSEHIKLQIS